MSRVCSRYHFELVKRIKSDCRYEQLIYLTTEHVAKVARLLCIYRRRTAFKFWNLWDNQTAVTWSSCEAVNYVTFSFHSNNQSAVHVILVVYVHVRIRMPMHICQDLAWTNFVFLLVIHFLCVDFLFIADVCIHYYHEVMIYEYVFRFQVNPQTILMRTIIVLLWLLL